MDVTKPLFRDLNADDPDPEATELESLCMNCHATVNREFHQNFYYKVNEIIFRG